MTYRQWLSDTVNRTIKTMAETLFGILSANGAGILDADWRGALSATAMAAILTILANISNMPQPQHNDKHGKE